MSSLPMLVFEKAEKYASGEALRVGERGISYQELSSRAMKIAAALVGSGAKCEAIGIVGQRTASSYFGVLGTLFAGCHYVPINPKYSEDRILSILNATGIRYLIGNRSDLEALESMISRNKILSISTIILPEGDAPSGRSWCDEGQLAKLAPLTVPVEPKPDDLAYIMFTSGSTGVPKGVKVTQSNLMSWLNAMSNIYTVKSGFRASQTYDLSFDLSVADMFFTWVNGGVLCVLPQEEHLLPIEYINREKIQLWSSVPTLASFMYKMNLLTPNIFPNLEISIFCGEPLPKYLADAWQKAAPNSTVENLYGPTEATIWLTRFVYSKNQVYKSFRNSILPIGVPFENHTVALVDSFGARVEFPQEGEIVYKGPQITKGYLGDQVKTDSAFVTFSWDPSGDIWYKSGDIGFYNDENNLECIGRKDGQIKVGGRRIEIGEIEAALRSYSKTADIVVVPLRDMNGIVTGCVAFVTNRLTEDEEAFIRNDSEKHLERIFFPRRINYIEKFPLAASGKIDRKALETIAQELLNGVPR